MKVVIRRSPPLMILSGSRGGAPRRALTLGLIGCAIATAYRFVVLLAFSLEGPPPVAGPLLDRWHLWLGAALLCAAGASVSWASLNVPGNASKGSWRSPGRRRL